MAHYEPPILDLCCLGDQLVLFFGTFSVKLKVEKHMDMPVCLTCHFQPLKGVICLP